MTVNVCAIHTMYPRLPDTVLFIRCICFLFFQCFLIICIILSHRNKRWWWTVATYKQRKVWVRICRKILAFLGASRQLLKSCIVCFSWIQIIKRLHKSNINQPCARSSSLFCFGCFGFSAVSTVSMVSCFRFIQLTFQILFASITNTIHHKDKHNEPLVWTSCLLVLTKKMT